MYAIDTINITRYISTYPNDGQLSSKCYEINSLGLKLIKPFPTRKIYGISEFFFVMLNKGVNRITRITVHIHDQELTVVERS